MRFSENEKERDCMEVCVIGLGNVGLPTAEYCFDKGLKVYGYDVDTSAVKKAKNFGILAHARWNDIPPPIGAFLVCVSTLLRHGLPDLSPVFDTCERIADKEPSASLVSIESTVTPGTSRKIYNEIFKRKAKLVHVPHRYWAGDTVRHGVKQPRVIGAICDKSMEAGLGLYEGILKIHLHAARSIEAAEMTKIAENAYRYMQIAFAEELKMICEKLELDCEEVRKACNTKWNVDVLEARDGIGGNCLPKDIEYLIALSNAKTLLTSARKGGWRNYLYLMLGVVSVTCCSFSET